MITFLYLIGGLTLLVVGAEWLVKGASRLAAGFGVSPLVIGLTVVAFGTSAPELAVSVSSAINDNAEIALGNVVGSNIFNVLFILGISALITPLGVSSRVVRVDVPLMIGASCLLMLCSLDGVIGRVDGWGMFTLLLMYTGWCIIQSRQESRDVAALATQAGALAKGDGFPGSVRAVTADGFSSDVVHEKSEDGAAASTGPGMVTSGALIVLGLGMLVLGSDFLVTSATTLARWLGASDLLIGLTIVAAGTSLPEVATSVMAAVRGERDIAVGNVVGSNLFNILGVLGMTGIVAGAGVEVSREALSFDLPVMLMAAIACIPIFWTGLVISRPEGCLFLVSYAIYLCFLILQASNHDLAGELRFLLIVLWACLTLFAGLFSTVRWWRRDAA